VPCDGNSAIVAEPIRDALPWQRASSDSRGTLRLSSWCFVRSPRPLGPSMLWIIAAVLIVHGLVHAMGFAKAFGYATLPQLTQPISRELGLLWLLAGALVCASGVLLVARPRTGWIVGTVALVLSQIVIITAWRDAWAGTIANAVLLLAVAYGFLTEGPWSFRAQFDRDVVVGLSRPITTSVVTDADVDRLPEPVRRYLRATGVVGRPRVHNYRLRFRGRIRSAPDARWMPFVADQQSFADEPTRLFLMRARMFGVPVSAFHRLVDGRATMQVKVAGAIPMVDASGDVMDRSEAVTLFNDMCLLAPGTLLDPNIAWETVDARTVSARFTNRKETIAATLLFSDDGLLTNFLSDDRSRSSADGKVFTRLRFSTPVRDYRDFGDARLAAHGEARWSLPDGEFTYGEFELVSVSYNVSAGGRDWAEFSKQAEMVQW
jgi:uncharacterized protein DUF6544